MSSARPGTSRPVWSHPGTAQEPRRRPTEGPTEGQDSLTRPQEASRGAQTRLGAISKRFHSDLGAPRTSKTIKKCYTVSEFRGFRDFAREPSTEAQNAPKGPPREAQMSPRCAPGRPRSGPRAPKTAPRGARSAPRGAQERTRQTPPEPFGSPFWPHLGAPGASFSSLLGVLFEPRARSARQSKARFEITGQKVFRDRCGPDVQRPLSTQLLN